MSRTALTSASRLAAHAVRGANAGCHRHLVPALAGRPVAARVHLVATSYQDVFHAARSLRPFSSSVLTRRQQDESASSVASPPSALARSTDGTAPDSKPLAEIKPRLSLTFTCTVTDCGHRSTHEFSKQAYTRGIVIVQCPSCENRHLIADHLGWFTETADEPRTVEEMVAAKGGQVRRGFKYSDGKGGHAIEIEPDEDVDGASLDQTVPR